MTLNLTGTVVNRSIESTSKGLRPTGLLVARSMLAVALYLAMLGVGHAQATDPTFVGRLALAIDEAAKLGLSDENKKQLTDLVARRESEAVELSQQLKGLSKEQQEEKLKPFREES